MSKLEAYFWNTNRAFILPLSNARIMPGALLQTEWRWTWPLPWLIDTNPEFRGYEGYAWELLELSEDDYGSSFAEASILVGTLEDRFEFGADVPLPQFGLNVELTLNEHVRARLEVEGVRVRLFDRGFAGHELRRRLRALKDDRDPRYAYVDDDYLITESYHLEGVRWVFSAKGAAALKAELEEAGIDLSAQAEVKWERDEELTFTGCAAVPVAVRGMKV